MPADPAAVKVVFLEAADLPPADRTAFLAGRCGADADLLRRVNALLAAHDHAGVVDETASYAGAEFAATHNPGDDTRSVSTSTEAVGQVIAGRYKLLERIGEGGMGSVWMADQTEPVKRRVALKLIKPGFDTKQVLTRFEAERQALALMDHPNIAKVLDGGLHDGRPYFVMELVKGIPITQFCDARKLTPQQRLELFVPVCQAIQHAHQKGVIHRDIKPVNVLVALYDDRPVPKVIDFGVAKATGSALTEHTLNTGFGAVVGTPQYMSPEQATFNNLDIDTRSDVYSLGILLYELLAGSPPFKQKELEKRGLMEMLRVVREEEPPRPSTKLSTADALPSLAANRGTEPKRLTGLLRNELDWIVMKALEKERNRRYETANGFATDVLRYLTGEPVQAHPPSTAYRLRKFVRKNKGSVIATAAVFVTLLAGVVGTTCGLLEARRQTEYARDEAAKKDEARKKTREVLDTLTTEAFSEWFTRELAQSPQQKEVLGRLLEQYQSFAEESGDDPDVRKGRVRALGRVGRIQLALGDRVASRNAYRQAAELAGTADAPITADQDGWHLVVNTREQFGKWAKAADNPAEAEAHFRAALAAAERIVAADPANVNWRGDVASCRMSLAGTISDQNRFEEAERENVTAAAELERLVGANPKLTSFRETLALLYNNQAMVSARRGRTDEALARNARAVEVRRALVADYPQQFWTLPSLARILRFRTGLLKSGEHPAEAEEVQREVIRLDILMSNQYPAMPEYRAALADDFGTLAAILRFQGKKAAAVEQAERGVAVGRQLRAEFPDDDLPKSILAAALYHLGESAHDDRRFTQAEACAREALQELDRLPPEQQAEGAPLSNRASFLRLYAHALLSQGKMNESLAVYRQAFATLEQLTTKYPNRADFRHSLMNGRTELALSCLRNGMPEEAVRELTAARSLVVAYPPAEQERWRGSIDFYEGQAVEVLGRHTEAELLLGGTIETFIARYKRAPDLKENGGVLCQAYWHRATVRDRLRKYAEAAADWGEAAKLADVPMDVAFYHAHRGSSLARGGNAKVAALEFADAIRRAEAALKGEGVAGITFYDGAAVYALAAGGENIPATIEKYAAEAVRLLGKAAGVGFLNDPAQRQTMSSADEYTTLRGRDDFKKLLADLEAKFPPKKEVLPPPRTDK